MTRVTIAWVRARVDELRDIDDSYLYALARNRHLIYIGMSYHTDVAVEIKQNMASFAISARNLDVYLGYIVGGNIGKVSRPLIRDVENLLICDNQPDYNANCKDEYTGRPLAVTNRGCPYLRKKT